MSNTPEDDIPNVLPPVPPPEPDMPSLRGQRHGLVLARLCAIALKGIRQEYPLFPAPCAGCVFTEGSHSNMVFTQVQDAMKAVLELRPMSCPCTNKDAMPDCIGWLLSAHARVEEEPLPAPWPFSFAEGERHLGAYGRDTGTAPRTSLADVLPFKKADGVEPE